MNFFNKHKKLCIVLICLLIFLIVLFIFLKQFMVDSSKDFYGDRLKGIENVKINNDRMKDMENEISKNENINSVNYDLRGRLVNITISVKENVSLDEAKGYADKTLEYFEEDEKKYYDVQIFLTSDKKDSEEFPMIGYKHKTSSNLVWKQ